MAFSLFKYSNYLPPCQKLKKKTIERFLKEMRTKGWTDRIVNIINPAYVTDPKRKINKNSDENVKWFLLSAENSTK